LAYNILMLTTSHQLYSLNYYQNELSFWTPQLHNRAGQDGFAASEFPLLYYVVGKLYGIFGHHEFLHRGLSLLLALLGWWLLFRLSSHLIGNEWLGMMPAIFLSSSPFYFFYANNFLTNVPAISLALMGWYAFFRYTKAAKRRLGWLYLMGGLLLLSALLKISEGISFVAILGLAALSLLTWRESPRGLVDRRHWPHFIAIALIVAGLVFAWYAYARAFNETYGNKQSLLGIFPIWEMSQEEWKLADYMINRVWWRHFQHPLWMWLLGLLTVAFFWFWNKLDKLLRWTALLLLLGVISYSLLWFRAFPMHDYYMLTLIIYPVFLLIAMLELLARKLRSRSLGYQWAVALILTIFAYLGLTQNDRIQWRRWHHPQHLSGLPEGSFELEPYLRAIGISRHDIVVSVPDPSPNITLYLMNQPGHSEAFNLGNYQRDDFQYWGVKYLIIHDSSYLEKEFFQPYLHTQVGAHKGVLIYDVRQGRMAPQAE
jgi:4-amino-4-deoxy-L-arabinose transferase-like glycosyltransferase